MLHKKHSTFENLRKLSLSANKTLLSRLGKLSSVTKKEFTCANIF